MSLVHLDVCSTFSVSCPFVRLSLVHLPSAFHQFIFCEVASETVRNISTVKNISFSVVSMLLLINGSIFCLFEKALSFSSGMTRGELSSAPVKNSVALSFPSLRRFVLPPEVFFLTPERFFLARNYLWAFYLWALPLKLLEVFWKFWNLKKFVWKLRSLLEVARESHIEF